MIRDSGSGVKALRSNVSAPSCSNASPPSGSNLPDARSGRKPISHAFRDLLAGDAPRLSAGLAQIDRPES